MRKFIFVVSLVVTVPAMAQDVNVLGSGYGVVNPAEWNCTQDRSWKISCGRTWEIERRKEYEKRIVHRKDRK